MHIRVLIFHLVDHAEYTYGEKLFMHSYLTMMHEFPRMFATSQLISQALLAGAQC